jgi:hypothetical protein
MYVRHLDYLLHYVSYARLTGTVPGALQDFSLVQSSSCFL